MPSKVTKIQVKSADPDQDLYNELEFSKPADTLKEAVYQYLIRTEGQEYSPERLKELVIKIVENRL